MMAWTRAPSRTAPLPDLRQGLMHRNFIEVSHRALLDRFRAVCRTSLAETRWAPQSSSLIETPLTLFGTLLKVARLISRRPNGTTTPLALDFAEYFVLIRGTQL